MSCSFCREETRFSIKKMHVRASECSFVYDESDRLMCGSGGDGFEMFVSCINPRTITVALTKSLCAVCLPLINLSTSNGFHVRGSFDQF